MTRKINFAVYEREKLKNISRSVNFEPTEKTITEQKKITSASARKVMKHLELGAASEIDKPKKTFTKDHAQKKLLSVMTGKTKIDHKTANKIIKGLNLHHSSHIAKTLKKTADKHVTAKDKARLEKKINDRVASAVKMTKKELKAKNIAKAEKSINKMKSSVQKNKEMQDHIDRKAEEKAQNKIREYMDKHKASLKQNREINIASDKPKKTSILDRAKTFFKRKKEEKTPVMSGGQEINIDVGSK